MHKLLFFVAIGLRMLASAEWDSWSMSSEIRSNRRCIDIPSNMSLCKDLNYTKMILPNLLDHETVPEAVSQSTIWLQLVDQNCSPHTRLFLCTLFAPLCFDPLVKPCRSLCEDTRRQCEPIMKKHRYSWPIILNCSKFEEKDPCVRAPEATEKPTLFAGVTLKPTGSVIKKMNRNSCTECEMSSKPSNKMICSSKFLIKTRLMNINSRNVIQTSSKRKLIHGSKKLKKKRLILKCNGCKNVKSGMKLLFGSRRKGNYMVERIVDYDKKKKWMKSLNRKTLKTKCKKYRKSRDKGRKARKPRL